MVTTGQQVAVGAEAIAALKASLRGDLIQRDDAEYEAARQVYNAMIDKHPLLIARVVDATDVIHAVNFAREQHLTLAVRGGGHNGPGLGTCDDGLVIDLGRMRGVRVDPVNKTARAEGGALLGDLDHATSAIGMAVPTGFLSTTGIGGLTLGGGIGYLSRAYGLTLDNLLSVDVVLADGSLVTASKDTHPDLFWAVRGGGGNFGVVTSFEFALSPVATVYGGPMMWPLEQAPEVLKFWRDFILQAPEDINGWFGFVTVPPVAPFPEEHQLKKMCAIVWCYTGPLEQAEERFKAIRAFGPPAIDFAGPIPFPVLQSMFDALYPKGFQWYWKADFFTTLSDEAIALHAKYAEQLPTMFSTMHLYPINGVAHRAASQDTAFTFRGSNFAQVIVGVDPDPANNPKMIEWAKAYHLALHPYSDGGGYINMVMDEGEDLIKAAYGANYARLAEIKAKYDPTNLFHVNQNIKPANPGA